MSKRQGTKWRKQRFAALCERDGAVCQKCRASHRIIWRRGRVTWTALTHGLPYTSVTASSNLEVDHRTPLKEGGTNDMENLWLLCRDCHRKKSAAEHSARLKRIFAVWRESRAAA